MRRPEDEGGEGEKRAILERVLREGGDGSLSREQSGSLSREQSCLRRHTGRCPAHVPSANGGVFCKPKGGSRGAELSASLGFVRVDDLPSIARPSIARSRSPPVYCSLCVGRHVK